MTKVIIYKQDSGVLAIIRPTEEVVSLHSIHAIALKDVPEGKPFKIIDSSEIPTDRNLRNAWTIDDSELTDGVGANYSIFPETSDAN
jgi:hypothetical protein